MDRSRTVSRSGRRSRGPALVLCAIAALLTAVIALRIFRLQAAGMSAAAIAMSADMDMRDTGKYWSFPILQSAGLVALLFAYIAAALGLWQGIQKSLGSGSATLERIHRQASWAVVVLVTIHMVATTLDAMGDSWRTVLIPGTWAKQGWPAAALGYNTAIYATYLIVLVGPSYYLRRWISTAFWRVAHRTTALFYVLAVWHAMILGLDLAYYSWLRPLIWLLQIPLIVLLMIRLYRYIRQKSFSPRPGELVARLACTLLFLVCVIAAAGILIIVLTGRSGFITTV